MNTNSNPLSDRGLSIRQLRDLHTANDIKIGEYRRYLAQRIVLNGALSPSSVNAAAELVRIAVKPYGPRVKF